MQRFKDGCDILRIPSKELNLHRAKLVCSWSHSIEQFGILSANWTNEINRRGQSWNCYEPAAGSEYSSSRFETFGENILPLSLKICFLAEDFANIPRTCNREFCRVNNFAKRQSKVRSPLVGFGGVEEPEQTAERRSQLVLRRTWGQVCANIK